MFNSLISKSNILVEGKYHLVYSAVESSVVTRSLKTSKEYKTLLQIFFRQFLDKEFLNLHKSFCLYVCLSVCPSCWSGKIFFFLIFLHLGYFRNQTLCRQFLFSRALKVTCQERIERDYFGVRWDRLVPLSQN